MTVRSAVLATGRNNFGGVMTLATVPAGETWIIKDVHIRDFTGASNSFNVNLYNPTTFVRNDLIYVAGVTQEFATWAGWVVAEPGDLLQLGCFNGLVTTWISGTKLIGVAP
jgi:hypothetical protein